MKKFIDGVSLVSLDVEKMDNNITHDLGRGAAKSYLDSRPVSPPVGGNEESDPFVTTTSLLEGLDLCTQKNYFEFDKAIYKQISGVGTGVKLAPPYACLAMGEFETKAFNTESTEEKRFLEMILFWKRFIDDILMLFRGDKEDCDNMVGWLNGLMPGIVKLKCNFSKTSLEFLDLRIMIVNGRLETELFVKPTNLQLFLDYDSNHPTHCKDAIIYSQALRVIERCSQPGSAEPHLENLREKFLVRNYPDKVVTDQFRRANLKQRKDIIFQQRKQNSKDDKVRLIFTHNESNPPLHQWIRQSRKLLTTPQAKELGSKFQITTRQPKNLARLVSGVRDKTEHNKQDNPGCYKCSRGCKVSCSKMKETKTFMSSNTKKSYKIRDHLDCDSSFVVYLITCTRCSGQYVGKSVTTFKKRHSNHKCEIRTKKGGLGQHYGGQRQCGYADVSITLIEQVEQGNRKLLADRELYWQNQLRAFVENGGNAHCIRKDY
jgi:tripartite motif-containing protein 2/3